MEKLKIEHYIPKSKEGIYYSIPFEVSENIEKITVSYSYDQNKGHGLGKKKNSNINIVDLGLMDEAGNFLGWSGSSHPSIHVGEYDSSAGYPIIPIHKGQWSIIIGCYHICNEGVTVEYNISFETKYKRWLFGDLHCHSTASDGTLDILALAKLATKKKFDFLAISNHNNFCENIKLPNIPSLTLIPAVEWTHYKGHMNFFGVNIPFENSFIANNLEEMNLLIENARKKGVYISVNHPKCNQCGYHWENDEAFDMVEVWNGPMRPTNVRAIKWWTEMLREGRRIACVGGSDFHKPRNVVRLGNPITAVFSDSPSSDDILNALSKGCSYITSGMKGPKLNLKCGSASFGDTVSIKNSPTLEIYGTNLGFARLILVMKEKEINLKAQNSGNFIDYVKIENTGFAYIKAVWKFPTGHTIIRAISNPIYFVE